MIRFVPKCSLSGRASSYILRLSKKPQSNFTRRALVTSSSFSAGQTSTLPTISMANEFMRS